MKKNHKQPDEPTQGTASAGLRYIWARFKTWDETANKRNRVLKRWRKLVLIFIVSGAFCGVLSSNLASTSTDALVYASQVLAFASTVLIALASYAGSEILTDELEKSQIKSRAAAESFKSESFLYMFRVPPYDNYREQVVFDRINELEKVTEGLIHIPIKEKKEVEGLPAGEMTIDKYIQERIKDQIYGYFNKKIEGLEKKHRRGKNFTLFFGFIGVILGALSATGMGFAKHTSAWIAFVTSASAAVSSFMATNRYQYLISTYQATSNRLQMLLARWEETANKSEDEARRFVLSVESELQRENQAWVNELSKKQAEEKDLAAQAAKQ